jgi:hypothetical protein
MRLFKTIHMAGPGDFIASVSGSSGDYDITLDNGETIEGYDETAGAFSTAEPVADDLVVFGFQGGSRAFTAANAEVIPAAQAADWLQVTAP